MLSVIALAGVLFYVGGSSAIAAKMNASYARSAHSAVSGVVKAPNGRADRQGRVVMVFTNAVGKVLEKVAQKVNKRGQFHVAAPAGARSVRLTVYMRPGRHVPHGTDTFRVIRGRSITLVVVFHRSGGGILPSVFPY